MTSPLPVTPEEREREIRARLDAATPGPWAQGDGSFRAFFNGPEAIIAKQNGAPRVLLIFNANFDCTADSALIANAPDDLAQLLAECSRLRAENEAMRADVERLDWLEAHAHPQLLDGWTHDGTYRAEITFKMSPAGKDGIRFAIDRARRALSGEKE